MAPLTRDKVRHLPRMGLAAAMRTFGLTARALRFYEEKGLVHAHRDRLNGRYYDAAARARLEWIARLRRIDVSLPDIREVLDAEDQGRGRECALAKVAERRAAVLLQLEAIDVTLAELGSSAPRLLSAGG